MGIVVEAAYGIYLLILSVMDVLRKEIPMNWLIGGIVFVPLGFAAEGTGMVLAHVLGLIPGLLFMFISFASHGQVGMADAAVLTVMGASFCLGQVITVIAVSLFTIAFVSMFLLMTGKLNRKSTLPYIPFIALGYGVSIFIR